MKVLFVCTGNTCRSPMAQALYEQLTGEQARSGGLGVQDAEQMSDFASVALSEKGITEFRHTSRQITPEDIAWADRIYVMTDLHRRILLAACPEAADKIRLLGGEKDILDPFGGSLANYLDCCNEIESCIQREFA